MKTELGCLALIGAVYFLARGAELISKLLTHGPKCLFCEIDAPIQHGWAQSLIAARMTLMSLVMLFLIPINVLGMLEMTEYHFLFSITKNVSIVFGVLFFGLVISLMMNKPVVALLLRRLSGLVIWYLYGLIAYVYMM